MIVTYPERIHASVVLHLVELHSKMKCSWTHLGIVCELSLSLSLALSHKKLVLSNVSTFGDCHVVGKHTGHTYCKHYWFYVWHVKVQFCCVAKLWILIFSVRTVRLIGLSGSSSSVPVSFQYYSCDIHWESSSHCWHVLAFMWPTVFRHMHIVTKNAYYLHQECLPIHLHLSAWLPFSGFAWNLMFGTSMKIFWENPYLVPIGHNIGHFTWRPRYILLLVMPLNCHKSAVFKLNHIRLLG